MSTSDRLMRRVAADASSVENDTLTMLSLIGFIMTQFPFAAAALSLTTDAARDKFARLTQLNRVVRPDHLSRDIALGRTGRRSR
jgi:hypothetical protein